MSQKGYTQKEKDNLIKIHASMDVDPIVKKYMEMRAEIIPRDITYYVSTYHICLNSLKKMYEDQRFEIDKLEDDLPTEFDKLKMRESIERYERTEKGLDYAKNDIKDSIEKIRSFLDSK
jgi:hypothetical protein